MTKNLEREAQWDSWDKELNVEGISKERVMQIAKEMFSSLDEEYAEEDKPIEANSRTYQRKRQFPTLYRAGKMLENEGFVKFDNTGAIYKKGTYVQIGNTCFELACRLAKEFGYETIESREDIRKIIREKEHLRKFAEEHPEIDLQSRSSPVNLLVRMNLEEKDKAKKGTHISLEAFGREYNYSVGKKEGFPVVMRISLKPIAA